MIWKYKAFEESINQKGVSMKSIKAIIIFTIFLSIKLYSQSGTNSFMNSVEYLVENTLNSTGGGTISLLDKMNDDQAIERINLLLNSTTLKIVNSYIGQFAPSEKRSFSNKYAIMFSYTNSIDNQFEYIDYLRNFYKLHPEIGVKSLLWLFSSTALEQIKEMDTSKNSTP